MSGTDPSDPFRNPDWPGGAGGPAYPPAPPPAPPPGPFAAPPPAGNVAPPPPGPPPAPAPKRSRWPIAVAAVPAVGAAAFAIGALGGDDDEPVAARDRDESVRDEDDERTTTSTRRTTTTTSTTSTSSTSTTTTTLFPPPDLSDLPDPGGPVVAAGSFTLQLPAGWRGVDLSNGAAGAGAALLPEDPVAAQAVQAQFDLLPRAVVLIGFDTAALTQGSLFAANVNVLVDPTARPGDPIEDILDLQLAGVEAFATVHDVRVVQLGGRDVGRIRSTFTNAPIAYDVLSYIVDTGDDVVVLSYSFRRIDANTEVLADASAATFTAG